jgi:hypothetical protein
MIKKTYYPMLKKLLVRLRRNVPVISLIASFCMMMFTPHVAPSVHNQLNTMRWEMLKMLKHPAYIPGFSLCNLHIFGPALKRPHVHVEQGCAGCYGTVICTADQGILCRWYMPTYALSMGL